jgi:hypothetical protein
VSSRARPWLHRLSDVRHRAEEAQGELERRNPIWPAHLTMLIVILLGLTLPNELTLGKSWVVPAVETSLLAGLVLTTPRAPTREVPLRRALRVGFVGLVSAGNAFSLFLLCELLIQGRGLRGGRSEGPSLLVGGAVLWLTAVLLFAVWFWELDRGGPVDRRAKRDERPDFLFPQMHAEGVVPPDWQPGFSDYLYLSLTNASSFAPAESFPLTTRAALVMSVQTLAALATFAVVLAHAVNNLR